MRASGPSAATRPTSIPDVAVPTTPPHSHLPHVHVEGGAPAALVPAGELWRYRELFYFFVWRDLKVRYKQTALGVLWAILQPLAATLIITVVFGHFGGFQSQSGVPYALYVFSGMLPWTFFSNAITAASTSLLSNTNLVTKVYFPRIIIPTTSIGAGLVDFCMGLALLPGLFAIYRVMPGPGLLLLPLLTVLLALLALAVGLFTAAASVQYRDVRHILPFALQLCMFASPIIYQPTRLPAGWGKILALNPLVGILAAYRSVIVGAPPQWGALGYSVICTVLLLLLAVRAFRTMEKEFADVI